MKNEHSSVNEVRLYLCDQESHNWEKISQTSDLDSPADLRCSEDHPAIHAGHFPAAPIASVRVLSAAFFYTNKPDDLYRDKDFYVVLECLADGWYCISDKFYRKEEAFKIAQMFCGLRMETARKLWQRRFPFCREMRSECKETGE